MYKVQLYKKNLPIDNVSKLIFRLMHFYASVAIKLHTSLIQTTKWRNSRELIA